MTDTHTNEASADTIFDNGKSAEVTSTKPVNSQANKRLKQELMSLMMNPAPGIGGFPASEHNLFEWNAHIIGPKDGVYEDRKYNLSISYPENYPFTSPTVKFVDACFHPNVDQHGNICLDILKDQWSPSMNTTQILLSLQSLLDDPNNDSPLNATAAAKWGNKADYCQEMRKVENKPCDKAVEK